MSGIRPQWISRQRIPLCAASRGFLAGHGHEAGEVEPRREGAALSREDRASQAAIPSQLVAGVPQGLEHGLVERVQLLRAAELHVCDAVSHRYLDAFGHGFSSAWPSLLSGSPLPRIRGGLPWAL